MTSEEMIQNYKQQFLNSIEHYKGMDVDCAFTSGMLMIVSSLKRADGVESFPLQINAMYIALHQIAEERGWSIGKNHA